MVSPLHVTSEVGKLKKILLHRPGSELENLMPEYLHRQLFDDIPYLVHAQEEHDSFADTLRQCGVEVLYLEDLLREAVEAASVKDEIIAEYVAEAAIPAAGAAQAVSEYLTSLPLKDAISAMMSGIRKSRIGRLPKRHLVDYTDEAYPFHADPLPNLYFTRDPFSIVGDGALLFCMANEVRRRETLFGKYIFNYHPLYGGIEKWYDRDDKYFMEGGDVLVLNSSTLAIGLSQRTDARGAELAARRLLESDSGFQRILVIDIPKTRAFMHLDTVMTMVDVNKFILHPNIRSSIRIYSIVMRNGRLRFTEEVRPMEQVFADALDVDEVTLIECGGGSIIDAAREQWNDGANTLAVAPGEVITYSRNYVTNRILRENGVTVHEIPSAELSRGRGGPRCMSMPFVRDDI
ncbi:MAG: arginine deiminase [Firmicutes bacterium]|nr:arginine deiminase [Bacillota bacterium]